MKFSLYDSQGFISDFEVKSCIGCGYCCRKGPCDIVFRFISWDEYFDGSNQNFLYRKNGKVTKHNWKDGGCPELVWEDGRWKCGLYLAAKDKEQKTFIAERLFFGDGCCSSMNTYRAKRYIPTPQDIENEEEIIFKLLNSGF